MWLDGAVPGTIARGLPGASATLLGGRDPAEVELWAVHPGGRTVLDAAQEGLRLDDGALADSRAVLRDYGNMSSATVMFVLERMLARGGPPRQRLRAGLRAGPDRRGDALSHRRRTA